MRITDCFLSTALEQAIAPFARASPAIFDRPRLTKNYAARLKMMQVASKRYPQPILTLQNSTSGDISEVDGTTCEHKEYITTTAANNSGV